MEKGIYDRDTLHLETLYMCTYRKRSHGIQERENGSEICVYMEKGMRVRGSVYIERHCIYVHIGKGTWDTGKRIWV